MRYDLQHLSALLALVLLSGIATAQTRVDGTVVNQRNQPIEGAKVARRTVTDQQGRFSLNRSHMPRRLRVRHPDYNISLVPVPEDGRMFIRLNSPEEESWDYHAWHPFVGLQMGSIFSEGGKSLFMGEDNELKSYGNQRWGVTCRPLGVMAGMMDDRFGFYGRCHFLSLGDSDDFDIRSRRDVFDFAVGGILHVWQPICVYAGAGLMFYTEHTDHFSDFNVRSGHTTEDFKRVIMDAGVLLRGRKDFLPHWMVNIGVFTPFERYNVHPNVGVGYIF